MGRVFNSYYGEPHIQDAVAAIRDAAEKHDIGGHAAAIRWTAFHSALDAKHGDAVVVGVSSVEHLHKNLDALEAGPLPAELADAITAVYGTIEHAAPRYYA